MAFSEERSTESSVGTQLKQLLQRMLTFADYGSEDQKRRLFSVLKTWDQNDRRKHPRQPCFIPVTCSTSGGVYTNFIRNISAGGAFVETSAPCVPGEYLTMMFWFPNQEEPVKTAGEIMWRAAEGVGVKFTTVNKDLERMVESHWSVQLNPAL